MRKSRVVAGIFASVLASSGLSLATAVPANAQIRFCTTRPGVPCIGPINGCALILGGSNYAFVDDGDSIVNAKGERWTCEHGKWTRAASRASNFDIGSILGRGLFDTGRKTDNICDPITIFCPTP